MGTLAGMVGVLSQDAFSEAPKVARVNTPRTVHLAQRWYQV